MKGYNFIFSGGGLSGLCTAYYLSKSGIPFEKALIIDSDTKDKNDRTWCFWGELPVEFEQLVSQKWNHLAFSWGDYHKRETLSEPGYRLIHSVDFYSFVKTELQKDSRFSWLFGSITAIRPTDMGAILVLNDGKQVITSQLFNSIPAFVSDVTKPPRSTFLWQHFKGWIIETEGEVFDADTPILMDFCEGKAQKEVQFFYVLPYSAKKALVEFTVFSAELFSEGVYDQKLRSYLYSRFKISSYRITATEKGAIPMTDRIFPAGNTSKIMNIGTAGGWVKPSTGYAFTRTIDRSRSLIAEMEAGVNPIAAAPMPHGRFTFYDRLLLNILTEDSREAVRIFYFLFRHNPMNRILRFLDERSFVPEEGLIFARLPVWIFLRALFRVYILPKFDWYQSIIAKLKIRFRYDI